MCKLAPIASERLPKNAVQVFHLDEEDVGFGWTVNLIPRLGAGEELALREVWELLKQFRKGASIMTSEKENYCKSFESPDETRPFQAHGRLDLLNFPDGTAVGRGVFEPGWRWSKDVKPIAGTSSCMAEHHGYCLSGSMVIQMDNGDEFRIQAGDAFTIPPGHDAWVVGNEQCISLDMTGFKDYAKKTAIAA